MPLLWEIVRITIYDALNRNRKEEIGGLQRTYTQSVSSVGSFVSLLLTVSLAQETSGSEIRHTDEWATRTSRLVKSVVG